MQARLEEREKAKRKENARVLRVKAMRGNMPHFFSLD